VEKGGFFNGKYFNDEFLLHPAQNILPTKGKPLVTISYYPIFISYTSIQVHFNQQSSLFSDFYEPKELQGLFQLVIKRHLYS
jgi:hypothetical protein